MTATSVAEVLDRSAERDRYEQRILGAWREGFAAGELAHADDYAAGFHDGALARKHAQHDLVEMARLDAARWGPLGREHFGDQQPGDYQGGALPLERPGGEVFLAGPAVHYHQCTAACRRYLPGWYGLAEAADILDGLPGNYADDADRLRRQAVRQGGAAA